MCTTSSRRTGTRRFSSRWLPTERGLERAARPVAEGRWTRGTARYRLRVGIDLCVPSAIYIKATTRLESFVPFHARPYDQVEHALDADLAAYVNAFLSHLPTSSRSRPGGC